MERRFQARLPSDLSLEWVHKVRLGADYYFSRKWSVAKHLQSYAIPGNPVDFNQSDTYTHEPYCFTEVHTLSRQKSWSRAEFSHGKGGSRHLPPIDEMGLIEKCLELINDRGAT